MPCHVVTVILTPPANQTKLRYQQEEEISDAAKLVNAGGNVNTAKEVKVRMNE